MCIARYFLKFSFKSVNVDFVYNCAIVFAILVDIIRFIIIAKKMSRKHNKLTSGVHIMKR